MIHNYNQFIQSCCIQVVHLSSDEATSISTCSITLLGQITEVSSGLLPNPGGVKLIWHHYLVMKCNEIITDTSISKHLLIMISFLCNGNCDFKTI